MKITSNYNHDRIAFKCNINSSSYSISQQYPKNTTRFPCIDFYQSSVLISTDCQKYNSNYIRESRIDYSHDFSGCYYQLKRLLLAIRHRFNGLFAHIIILVMVFMSAIIILMDVFKYGFNTGPVRKKRQRLEQKYQANYSKKHKATIIRRPTYVYTFKLQTIPEEDEVQSESP
jgi:hypothetical protein